MKKENKAYYNSPIGWIEIIGEGKEVISIKFLDEEPIHNGEVPEELANAVTQIHEYFEGKRKKFSIPLRMKGTEFQKKVWKELQKIPFGKTASYKEIAAKIGKENASRAVGNANNQNNHVVVIPCHRVIGSGGELVGFGGGLWRKEWLLNHEKPKLKI